MASTERASPLYFDSHMHTPLCNHAFGEPEEYAEHAISQGLAGIVITCHSPMPKRFWPHVRMAEAQFEEYLQLVERCRKRFEGRLEVRLGLESDYFPGFEDWAEKLHQRADFHYILGSVHWQGPEYGALFDRNNEKTFRASYFDNLATSAETGLFDSLAHPDLIKNYQHTTWNFEEWIEPVENALDRIAKRGVAMELNTSGLHKNYTEMNPGIGMLRMMNQRNIPVVIGSDSHKPTRVGENFFNALQTLQDAGYHHVSIFKNRKREELKIAELLASMHHPEKEMVAS